MQLFTDFKLANESVRKEVMCNIFSEFGKPINSVQSLQLSIPTVITCRPKYRELQFCLLCCMGVKSSHSERRTQTESSLEESFE